MNTPSTKFRFSAAFSVPLGAGGRKTRRFKGTMSVAPGSDLVTVVIGTLAGLAKEETLGDVQWLQLTASVVRKSLRAPRPPC